MVVAVGVQEYLVESADLQNAATYVIGSQITMPCCSLGPGDILQPNYSRCRTFGKNSLQIIVIIELI